jgi:hypothetical protein
MPRETHRFVPRSEPNGAQTRFVAAPAGLRLRALR